MGDNYLGEIRLFSSATTQSIPRGWLPCEGQILQVSQNQALYSLLGNKFGGTAPTTFALPDFRGRTPIGVLAGSAACGTTGKSNGSNAITLTETQVPSHTHAVQGLSATPTPQPVPNGNYIGPAAKYVADPSLIYADPSNPMVPLNSGAMTPAGESTSHDNRQPLIALRFYIATIGNYPQHQ